MGGHAWAGDRVKGRGGGGTGPKYAKCKCSRESTVSQTTVGGTTGIGVHLAAAGGTRKLKVMLGLSVVTAMMPLARVNDAAWVPEEPPGEATGGSSQVKSTWVPVAGSRSSSSVLPASGVAGNGPTVAAKPVELKLGGSSAQSKAVLYESEKLALPFMLGAGVHRE